MIFQIVKSNIVKKGFTLVEMVVAVGIFAFIAAAILVGNSGFNSNVILTNLAYEVALSIRQAQVYGLSVLEFDPGTNQFNVGYGVYMHRNNKVNYMFYADSDNDGSYDGVTELLETYSLKRGNTVSKFCATNIANVKRCSDVGDILYLNITFKRPEPDANIETSYAESYKTAEIHITSPNGNNRIVSVEETGQISIHQ